MTIKDLERDLIAKGGNLSGIYKITRKSDGKIYIGQSVCIVSRIKQHIDNKRELDSTKIDGAIQAEGWENFTYEVVQALPDATTEQLWFLEQACIATENAYTNGFNKTKGNHIGKYSHKMFAAKKHEVSISLTKRLRSTFGLDFANKTVLLIGVFEEQFIKKLEYDDCTVIKLVHTFEEDEAFGEYIMEELKNYMGVKFDLIIANPPYGKIGANITKTIIDTIDYDEYVNLLPANDYIRNDSKDLYKYVDPDSMTAINNGFSDAAVTTHVARITKKPHRYISWEEFQIENYIDPSLTKYFYELRNREHYAIDATEMSGATDKLFKTFSIDTTVIFGNRDVNHRHLPYSKDTDTYKYNVLKNITNAELFTSRQATRKGVYDGWLHVAGIVFNTCTEKDNFVSFIYSDTGFRFLAKLFTAVNIDGTINCGKVFPKVDWTHSWTVEEILADYGYTQKEIDEVMADLANFKGMED